MTPTPSERAGRLLRQVRQEDSQEQRAEARKRFLDAAQKQQVRRTVHRWWVGMAAAVMCAGFWFVSRPGPSVTFNIGDERYPGQLGAHLVAHGDQPLRLHFSDGAEVSLQGTARARVTETTPKGATVILEHGRAYVRVPPKQQRQWSLAAGPYTVTVTGTQFDIQWDTTRGVLQIDMIEGVVSVRGPGADPSVEVRDQQRFVSHVTTLVHSVGTSSSLAASVPVISSARSDAPEPSAVPEPLSSSSMPTPEPSTSASTATAVPLLAPGSVAASSVSSSSAPSWATRVARREHRAVLEEAERLGIENVLQRAGIDDLWALSDAARFAGSAHVSRKALLAIRSRFAGSPRAASAAFLLGRMADDGGATSTALEWYDRYMTEAPAGPLAAEALGRKMIVLKNSGSVDAAHQVAQVYLRRFPNGAYSGTARELVPAE